MKRGYRINDDFDLLGAFWSPDAPEESITGTLTACNGRVEVVNTASYTSQLDANHFRAAFLAMNSPRNPQRIPVLHGATSNGLCTLLNSLVIEDRRGITSYPLGYQISAVRLHPARTVMGIHVSSADSETLDSATYSLTKLHRLLPAPWTAELSNETHSYVVPMAAKEVFTITSNEMDSEICFEIRDSGGWTAKRGVAIKPQAILRVVPNKPQSLDWFNRLAFRLENFFTLFLGTSLSVRSVQMFRGDNVGWLIEEINKRAEKLNISMCVRCPFESVGDALKKWLAVPDAKQSVELTLLGVVRKSTLFRETEFLSLAQALEGFARITFSRRKNEDSSFRTLINQTYDLLSPEFANRLLGDKDAFAEKVVHTRDYYTHIGIEGRRAVIRDGSELFLLNKCLQAFVRCVLLIDLGIEEHYLREPIMYQATRWKIW